MKQIIIPGIFALALFAGNVTAQAVKPVPDSLLFSVTQLCSDTVKKIICRLDVKPELQYDFTYQYPYYRLKDKKWQVGDQFQLEFTSLPSKGTIYIFSLDGNNTPGMQPVIRLDSTVKLPLIYPSPLKGFRFEIEGTEYMSLWYASDSIVNVEKLIRGIEFTMGSIVKRNNRQLGKYLLLPNQGWHFENSRFGFVIEPELYEIPERFIIPLIIEMTVTGKQKGKLKKN